MGTLFSKLKSLKVADGATRPFRLDNVDLGSGTPVLTVRHAGRSNAAYWNALLKLSNDRPASTRAGGITAAKVDDAQREDIGLLAKHVVVGWANVNEDDPRNPGQAKPSEFSAEKCEEFLLELAADAPDYYAMLKAFVGDADNFRDRPPLDGAELGKP